MTDAQVMVFQALGDGGDPYVDISLFSDVGGKPGSLIATMGTDLKAPAEGGIVTASGPTPQLAAGTSYWLALTPFDSGSQIGWELTDSSLALPTAGMSPSFEQGAWVAGFGGGASIPD